MQNPTQVWQSWFALSSQAARLTWEAQAVMALRLMRLAQGARSKVGRMVAEKVAAMAEAQRAAAAAAITGVGSHRVAKKVMGVYRKRVRGNRRRFKK